jgi:hypothetical protein
MASASRWPFPGQMGVLNIKGVGVIESLMVNVQGLTSRARVGRRSPGPLQGSARYIFDLSSAPVLTMDLGP